MGTDDATPGQVYAYIGTKTNVGSPVERAGLTNGELYGVRVLGALLETRDGGVGASTRFDLAPLGNVENQSGAQLEAASDAVGVTEFLRPEDGSWDPKNPRDFYFNTTDRFSLLKEGIGLQDARSRLWRLRFDDLSDPSKGGTIEAVLSGNEPHQMLDNMTVDGTGQVLLQEDPGGQNYLAKVRLYDIASDTVRAIAQHDPNRFVTGAPGFLTNDEESSGIVDVSSILGRGTYLLDVQAHYSLGGELVEGGQLLMLSLTPPNSAPTVVDDSAVIANAQPTEIDVLANDSDIDGDALTISAASNGLRGTTQVTAAGKVLYTPESGFVGADAFSYTVSDGRGGVAVGRVTVQVTDTTAPVVTITTPKKDNIQRELKEITGTVDDPTATVEVEIYSTQKYFDGRSFGTTRTRIATTRDGNTWTVPADSLPATGSLDGIYLITAHATDVSGNAATAQVTLRVDGNAPTAFIGIPRDKSVIAALPLIAGRAIDAPGGSGVARVAVLLRRAADGFYWNGQEFAAAPSALNATLKGYNFAIRENLPAREDLNNGIYTFTLYAFDRAGNRSITQSSVRVVSGPTTQ